MMPHPIDAFSENGSAKADKFEEIPLNGLPAELRKQVRSSESLIFAEFLFADREHRRVAVQMIMHEWLANPFSVLPLKILLRRILPVSWVSRVVSFKKKSRRESAIAS